MSSAPSIPTIAPLALWRVARAFICVLHDLFGAPEDVAGRHTLTRAAYQLLLSWLRVGEAMMRRLIAIEAAAYPQTQAPAPRAKRPRRRRLIEFWPDKPEAWRVSFRCLPPMLRQAQHDADADCVSLSLSKAERLAPKRFHSAWPLAERYEALLRAFNDPLPLARRLARRLNAAPARLDDVLAAPAEYAHRVDQAETLTQAAAARLAHAGFKLAAAPSPLLQFTRRKRAPAARPLARRQRRAQIPSPCTSSGSSIATRIWRRALCSSAGWRAPCWWPWC